MIRKRILNKWAIINKLPTSTNSSSSSSSSRLPSSSSSPPLSPTTSSSLSLSSLWKKHSFSYFASNIIVPFLSLVMIFSIVNIIPHMDQQQQQQLQFVSSDSSNSLMKRKKNTNSRNDSNNTNKTTNSSYNNSNSNIYDQYVEEASSLRCTPLSEIFTDQHPSSSSLLQRFWSYFNNFNLNNIDHTFIIEDDDYDHYYAVCEFIKNRPNSQHFPHTMQQLYPCFSLWLWNQNNARNKNMNQDKYKIITSNILIMKEIHNDNTNSNRIPIINEFADGFLTALIASSSSSSFDLDLQLVNKIKIVGKYDTNFNSSSNVSVVHVDNYTDEYHMDAMFSSSSSSSSVNSNKKKDLALPAYTMHHPNDAKMMRQIIFDYYNITTARGENVNISNNINNNNNTTMLTEVELCRLNKEPSEQDQEQQEHIRTSTKRIIPVIGFLNRKRSSGRYVTNHVSIVTALEEEFYNTSANANNKANVQYLSNFDGLSFVDQISYMNTIDILIGPHGAQLTSIPFLPECSGILELFPIGYYIPTFFGSLSRSTGHYHISYYTGSTTNNNSTNNNRVRRVRIRNEEIRLGHQTLQTRKVSRRKTIIADPDIIIHGVKKLISYWQSCQCMTYVEKDSCSNNW
ncbi:hypothetical protein FRACYDRAFT_244984 [Fragilariopsis cylindrus CCMP1102]|uniref:Glycosyltransferase 61 catalytic domain-containing protein n=1 Tax=Fragilariopsis cylindrus CCMP1102 TaxID=635003 RepID=A0A1E7F185_9STRA|nr:hypothetical protein FRACYDRAFT_244984 [Fragilariopsis cylindrus CCMP1102]|eukprot:OEU11864.1 hypothetical protein FRACYDRAFT_244984 [Fragilariopsis cylindrus CCMP1102]